MDKFNEGQKILDEGQKRKEWKPTTFDELLEKEFPETEFVIDKLIPAKAISCLSGNPGSGKTWLLLEIALAVAEGREFLEKSQTTKQRVLIIDEERRAFETQRRLKKLSAQKTKDIWISCLEGIKIDEQETREKVIQFCLDNEIKLVIFDSLRSVNTLDENDSKSAQKIIDAFKEFTAKGITTLVSHHNRKEGFLASKDPAQILRGSIAFLAGITSLISLDKSENLGKRLEMTISHAKMNEGEKNPPFQIALQEDEEEKMHWEFIREIEMDYTKIEKAKESILAILEEDEEKYQVEIINTLKTQGFAERTLRRGIEELEGKEKIQYSKKKGQGNKKFYHLST